MDVSKFNVLSWLKVLVACLALVLSGCGGSDRQSGTVDPEEHQNSDEGEEETQDDEDEEKDKGEGLSFLDKVAKEKGTCFAGKEVKSLNVYVPFLDFGKDGVVESDDFLAKVAPEVSILHLSDDVVIGDLAEVKGKKGLSTDKVQEGVSADDIQYVKYTFQGKIVAEFKNHDEIFEVFDDGDFLDNEEAKGHLLYYEFIKTYFGKKGNFKLGVNGKTFVATSDSSLFSFEFDGIKEVKKGMAEEENEEVVEVEDVVEEEDAGSEVEAEVVEEEEAADEEAVEVVEEAEAEEAEAVVVEEGSEGADSTSSSEGTVVEVTEDSAQEEVAVSEEEASEEEAEEEKDVTYYEADVIATYYLADLSDNVVQVKNAAVCAEEKEAAEKEKESEDTKAEEDEEEESSAEGDDAAQSDVAESDAAVDSDADAEAEDATEGEVATDEVADEDAEESSAEGASEEGTVAETEDATTTDEEVDSETEEEATTSEEEDSVSQEEEEKVSS